MPEHRQTWQIITHDPQQYRNARIFHIQPDVAQSPSNLTQNIMDVPGKLLSNDEIQLSFSTSCETTRGYALLALGHSRGGYTGPSTPRGRRQKL
ncbi:hypothetical protein MMC31_007099, partial [Peltigera leucophlebia]|nr:hypothetical protein [Peltigera leucophlebia]